MATISEKFINDKFPNNLQISAKKLLDSGMVNPILTSDANFSSEINGLHYHEVNLEVKERRLKAKCDCEQKKVCEHILATLLLTERFDDLKLALKKNVKAEIILEDVEEISQENSVEYLKNYDKEETVWRPELTEPTFEGFPEIVTTRKQKIRNYTRQLHHCQFVADDKLKIDMVINLDESVEKEHLMVQLYYQTINSDHTWSKRQALETIPSHLGTIYSALSHFGSFKNRVRERAKLRIDTLPNVFRLPFEFAYAFFKIGYSENIFIRKSCHCKEIYPIHLANDWQLKLDFSKEITAYFTNGSELLKLNECQLLTTSKFMIRDNRVILFEDYDCHELFKTLRQPIVVQEWEIGEWVKNLLLRTNYPEHFIPHNLQWQSYSDVIPKAKIKLRTAKYKYRGREQLHAEVSFIYADSEVREVSNDQKVASFSGHKIYQRNQDAEEKLREYLIGLDFRFNASNGREEYGWKLIPSKLDKVVGELLKKDWVVLAEGKNYRKPQDMNVKIKAGNNDWFELEGKVQFDNLSVSLPQLLQALKGKQNYIRLGDGSFGILPLEWLKNFTVLNEIGLTEGELIKFRRSQAIILDQLLQKIPNCQVDQRLTEAAKKLQTFTKLAMVEPVNSFLGQLRPYQKEALSWLNFLAQYGFGGILADDMGLGKTVQVLAHLESRRQATQLPSLVVAPRSLMFNWLAEAAKFTPEMRVMIHQGGGRDKSGRHFHRYELILTTYGTLVRDVGEFVGDFDYVILDESQAIKNADTQNAKAAKLLRTNHRLCLSGTPIENSITELFSQFEFLNPGFINNCSKISQNFSEHDMQSIRQAIKPFVLRRTKEQVATDLPPKEEQVVYCEMNDAQRFQYNELRDFYRDSLLGGEGETFDILSAIMRLRQVACHPGLVDPQLIGQPAVKTEVILPKIKELITTGHKVLIFSQFRSYLQIVKGLVEAENIDYSYIDGTVSDRQKEVNEFQDNPDKKLFLISLKAGGTGLNLTAADYVFILDPWWNPALEAQAVDRAYRIGQKNSVFAYRFVCRDTVEEKIMAIKAKKQKTADAIISGDALKPSDLTKSDLEFIFS